MTITLITGANTGLGLETARRLLAVGHDVWLGARDPARGVAAADEIGARFVLLDVTDDGSLEAAVRTVADAGGLDVLVNNAGIVGTRVPPAETTAHDLVGVFDTSVLGPVRVVRASRHGCTRRRRPCSSTFRAASDPSRSPASRMASRLL
jgi:NAD(P)-dependent dehydrogenase (short-subunit alcohol dehydrogenase family)